MYRYSVHTRISSADCLLPVLTLSLSVALMAELKHAAFAARISFRPMSQVSSTSTTLLNHKLSTHDCSCSPYTLSFASFLQGSGRSGYGGKYCFLVGIRGCEPSSPCCGALLQSRVDSLQLQAEGSTMPKQQHEISQVEVNGSRWQMWDEGSQQLTGSIAGGNRYGGVIRVFGLAADSSTLPGTIICITTASSSSSSSVRWSWLQCLGSESCRFVVSAESSLPADADTGSSDSERTTSIVGMCPVLVPQSRFSRVLVQQTPRAQLSPPPVRTVMGSTSSPKSHSPPNPVSKPLPPRASPLSLRPSRPPPSPKRSPSPSWPSFPPPPSYPPVPPLATKISADAAGPISQVCGAISLLSPLDKSGDLSYTFGKQISCDGTAAWMAKNLTDAARKAGAQIAVPFVLEACSAVYDASANPPVLPYVKVCGSFTSVQEAAKIQDQVFDLLSEWRYRVIGRQYPIWGPAVPMCNPQGYTIQSMIWGYEEESPVGYMDVQCHSRV